MILRKKNSPKVREILTTFRKKLLEESMITYTIFPDNFLIQRISETEYHIRIIDGIGMHVLFPLPYYSKRLARHRQRKIFKKFMVLLRNKYGLQVEIDEPQRRFFVAEKFLALRRARLFKG